MEDKINKIWYQMNMKEITSEQARQQVLDLFAVSGSFLDPIGWVVKVYGRSKLEYLSDNLIDNDTWWEMMEDYGKYVERYVRKNCI